MPYIIIGNVGCVIIMITCDRKQQRGILAPFQKSLDTDNDT